jgi:hypothetical protein
MCSGKGLLVVQVPPSDEGGFSVRPDMFEDLADHLRLAEELEAEVMLA